MYGLLKDKPKWYVLKIINSSSMKYRLYFQQEDYEIIQEFIGELSPMKKQELVACYNRQVRAGILAVRRQALYLCALREVFLEVFGDSPVDLEGGVEIDMKGLVILVGDQLIYLEEINLN
jgi:hypothetical protein